MDNFIKGMMSIDSKVIGREVALGMTAAVAGYYLVRYLKRRESNNG